MNGAEAGSFTATRSRCFGSALALSIQPPSNERRRGHLSPHHLTSTAFKLHVEPLALTCVSRMQTLSRIDMACDFQSSLPIVLREPLSTIQQHNEPNSVHYSLQVQQGGLDYYRASMLSQLAVSSPLTTKGLPPPHLVLETQKVDDAYTAAI